MLVAGQHRRFGLGNDDVSTPFVLLLIAAGLMACGSGSGQSTSNACSSEQALTYANFGETFIGEHCLACHSASGPQSPKLDTLAQVRAVADDIDRTAAAGPDGVNTYMPQGASVDEGERRKLGEWLACGAPE